MAVRGFIEEIAIRQAYWEWMRLREDRLEEATKRREIEAFLELSPQDIYKNALQMIAAPPTLEVGGWYLEAPGWAELPEATRLSVLATLRGHEYSHENVISCTEPASEHENEGDFRN